MVNELLRRLIILHMTVFLLWYDLYREECLFLDSKPNSVCLTPKLAVFHP